MNKLVITFLILSVIFLNSCSSKVDQVIKQDKPGNNFSWSEKLDAGSLPDIPLKGFLNGREVSISYINFEKWRGSNDNVINFSINKPEQLCGFIENFQGFRIVNKGSQFTKGEFVKANFNDQPGTVSASVNYSVNETVSYAPEIPFSLVLKIDNIDNQKVSARIAMTFNDANKSWIAGKFDAIICNN